MNLAALYQEKQPPLAHIRICTPPLFRRRVVHTIYHEFFERPHAGRPYSPATIRTWSVTTWLIAINVAIFVLDMLTHRSLANLGYFSATKAIGGLQTWRFLTFQFLHLNVSHIFFNMLSLYFFGPMVEQYLGRLRFLGFYLLCGMAGAGCYLVLMVLHVLGDGSATPLLGASAGIFGVLIAAATRVAPDATASCFFPAADPDETSYAGLDHDRHSRLYCYLRREQRRRRSRPSWRSGSWVPPDSTAGSLKRLRAAAMRMEANSLQLFTAPEYFFERCIPVVSCQLRPGVHPVGQHDGRTIAHFHLRGVVILKPPVQWSFEGL